MTATLLEITELPIRDIDTEGRLRPIAEASVISLMASIEEIGLQSEIHVRRVRHQGGRLRLIAGGHRLEALSRLGCTSVAAKVWDCTDDWALMSEIDDNLAHADLGALDLSIFLAQRKQVYERMYPETKQAAFKGNRHTGSLASDMMSFTRSVAEQKDMSKRQVERLVSAGQALDRAAIEQLRRAPQKVSGRRGQTARLGHPYRAHSKTPTGKGSASCEPCVLAGRCRGFGAVLPCSDT